ncbi:AzlD domain-containing protein [Nocardioides sp. WV_118_6]|uniref:branched-chain amino acid transporter permease n=1 Tax=Nocardioides simplex TaxID=2045 RepID=UPI0021506532|nr:AzlD domain-containing protein [Pimelobacter simplex]UUW91094.1 AzlD domain-containing protein [Pimelobacter simplex]UUW94922.1 AzlD domain-containing protein [Pimelobacter simplex]
MPEPGYVAGALAAAVAVTVALRALPFVAKAAVKDSPLLADLGRWMPLGAVTVLAVYGVSRIDLTGPDRGAGGLLGVAVTIAVHLWRRNLLLSIVAGTTVCVAVSSLL